MSEQERNREDDETTRNGPADPSSDRETFAAFTTDFYRGEVDRIATWRTRLDQTTNWAVVVMAAILTWAFTSADNPHYVLLIGMLAVTVFLGIEAQRYQEYDAWRDRVRVLEGNVFAEVFDRRGPEVDGWDDWLSSDLRRPALRISFLEAVGHRLQHIYFPLLTVLLVAWGLRISVYEAGETWTQTASIATIPGEAVVGGVAAVYLGLLAVAVWSARQGLTREFENTSGPTVSPDERERE